MDFELGMPLRLPNFTPYSALFNEDGWGNPRFEQVQHHVVASEDADRVLVDLTGSAKVAGRKTSAAVIIRS